MRPSDARRSKKIRHAEYRSLAVSYTHLSDGSVREVVTILNDYEASMACNTTSLFLIGAAGDGDVSVARVTIADGGVTNLWEGPYPVSVASLTGRVWIAYSDELLNQTFPVSYTHL